MGMFSFKAVCATCSNEVPFINRVAIANKEIVCAKCMKLAGLKREDIISMTSAQVKSAIGRKSESKNEIANFNPTKKIGSYVEFDTDNEKWLVLSSFLGKRDKSTIYKFEDIIHFELLEDGESIASGGLGRALVGGALFGGVGAVVGGVTGNKTSKGVCTSLKVKVTVDDVHNPTVYINLLNTNTKKNGIVYQQHIKYAEECLSMFQLICDKQKKSAAVNQSGAPLSAADEIKKFKSLLDEGIISEEEFNEKKKQLLS
ncbi:SHOCT domain-containing protein [Alkalihalobacillus trypoxylicola]|uniref:SHOCT domain-containing protein n=1 Tax=Alkalihalobacillus trypoxylicola TaxID=519424 RepID=A0A161PHD5_9BACI|nr:SHOCT domain-containing protein [Alkalihalobacillus trypoxylicola]KYG33021.1 hypothetical protein AZF04_17835 [Alkalihalobacillus trypoxylicola]